MKKTRIIMVLLLTFSFLLNDSIRAFALTDQAAVSTNSTGLITYNDRKETGDEVLLIRMDYKGNRDQFMQDMYKNAIPNVSQKIKTVASKGITSLSVSSNYFGVVIEPVEGQNFVIDLVGVNDPKQVTVDTSIVGNDLTINVSGDRKKSLLISTASDNRVNIVRIGVPVDTIQNLQVYDEKNSCILVNNIDVPIFAEVGSGTARVQSEQLTAGVIMKCSSGDIIVKANQAKGPINLSTSSGDAVLLADTVSGQTEVTASSGDITVEVDTLHHAVLQATSGDVSVKVTQIVNSVKASVTSGDLAFFLTKKPANLRFVFDGKDTNDDITLPQGWRNGYNVGNGKPILHLGVGNGELELKVG